MNNTTPAIRCEIDEIAVIGKRKTKRSLIPTFMGLFRVFKKLKDLGESKNGILDFFRKKN